MNVTLPSSFRTLSALRAGFFLPSFLPSFLRISFRSGRTDRSRTPKTNLLRLLFRAAVLALTFALLPAVLPRMTASADTCGGLNCEYSEDRTSVTIYGPGALGYSAFFNNDNLRNVIIKEGVTSIGNGAFFYCDNLQSVEFPSTLTYIDEDAFYRCSSLDVDIPSTVTYIGPYAFVNTALKSVIIPSGVTSIEEGTFYGCSNLESIKIPASVTSIGESAFASCSKLESVEIPASVTSIGERAFGYLKSIKNVKIIRSDNKELSFGDQVFYASGYDHGAYHAELNYTGTEDAIAVWKIEGGDGFTINNGQQRLEWKDYATETASGKLWVELEPKTPENFDVDVIFVFLRSDGTRGVPFDIKEGTVDPVLTIKKGDTAVSKSDPLTVEITAGAKEDAMTASFSKEIKDLAPGKYAVAVSGLPKEWAGLGDGAKYKLTAKAEVNKKDGGTVITVYLIFADPGPSEPVVYALPEDGIGAYALLPDGTKEYLLFHTYDICMAWLGSDELCSGPQRCFHKDGK